jgi:hypothetical protein
MWCVSCIREVRICSLHPDQAITFFILQFLLQIALLQHTTKPRPEAARPGAGGARDSYASTSSASGQGGAALAGSSAVGKTASGSGASAAASSSARSEWGFGAIAEMLIGGGSSRDARFPEKLIKRLNERLQSIAMGKDPMFRDQSLRSTIGVFYGQYQDATFQKQMRENRKVEDLILHFATAAQASLRKRATGDEWKQDLELQVGQFVKIIREALKAVHSVPKELTERLETYSAKLAPPKTISLGPTASAAGAANGTSSRSSASTNASTLPPPTNPSANSSEQGRRDSAASLASTGDPIAESTLIQAVGRLFKVQESQFRMDVESLRKTCTDKVSRGNGARRPTASASSRAMNLSQAAVADLKRCTANINLGGSWPGRREDFLSDEAWQTWKSSEQTALSTLIARLCENNPQLLKTTTGLEVTNGASVAQSSLESSAADTASSGRKSPAADSTEPNDDAFTYIPPDPKRMYKRALEICLDYDLEQIRNQEDAEEVSLSILSPTHVDLLKKCAQWWRISAAYMALANFDTIRIKFEAGEAPLDCLSVAMVAVDKVLQETQFEKWMIHEVSFV